MKFTIRVDVRPDRRDHPEDYEAIWSDDILPDIEEEIHGALEAYGWDLNRFEVSAFADCGVTEVVEVDEDVVEVDDEPEEDWFPQYHSGKAWKVTTPEGEFNVPEVSTTRRQGYKARKHDLELLEEYYDDVSEAVVVSGWFSRTVSPDGDSETEWAGPFPTKAKAEEHIKNAFGIDPKKGVIP